MTKQILKYMALVAIMGVSSFAFISCNDEDETRMDKQTVCKSMLKKPYRVDFQCRDQYGNVWVLKGTVDVKLSSEFPFVKIAHWDLTLTNVTTGESYHFKGVSQHQDGDTISLEGILFDSESNEIRLSTLPQLPDLLNDCINNYVE